MGHVSMRVGHVSMSAEQGMFNPLCCCVMHSCGSIICQVLKDCTYNDRNTDNNATQLQDIMHAVSCTIAQAQLASVGICVWYTGGLLCKGLLVACCMDA